MGSESGSEKELHIATRAERPSVKRDRLNYLLFYLRPKELLGGEILGWGGGFHLRHSSGVAMIAAPGLMYRAST